MKRFRPGIVPTLVVALLLPLLVSLGFWQLSRGAEKSALLQSYAERRAAEPMASTELQHTDRPGLPSGSPVRPVRCRTQPAAG